MVNYKYNVILYDGCVFLRAADCEKSPLYMAQERSFLMDNLTIRKKLGVVFTLLILVFLGASVYAVIALKNINDRELYYQYYGRDYVDTKDEDAYDSELSVRDFIDWCYEGMPEKWKRPGTYGDLAKGYSSLIEDSPWFRELSEMIRAGMSDLHIDNFGIARRNGKECIVVLDSGIIEQ